MTVGVVYDERYLAHDSPGHPERAARLSAVREALTEAGLWERLAPIAARPADDADLARVHSPEHVERVRRSADQGRTVWFDADTYACPASAEAAYLAAGGVCAAVDAVMDGAVSAAFCAVRPPGHHALPDRAMGFCLFNNMAVAVRYARGPRGVGRVLIIDWDVHHGNGTQAAFYADGDVMYLSTHQWPFYPGTGAADERGRGEGQGTTLNYPLSRGDGDEAFLAALDDGLDEASDFEPEFVFISAGFDAHRDDPLAGLNLTDQAYAQATRRIRRVADRTAGGRIVSMLEGGYDLDTLGRSARAHVAALMEPLPQP